MGEGIVGILLQIDEIKCEERLRWCPKRNLILSLCREHGWQFPTMFASMNEAWLIAQGLKDKRVHIGSGPLLLGICGRNQFSAKGSRSLHNSPIPHLGHMQTRDG